LQPEQHLKDQGGHGERQGLHGHGSQAIQVTPAQLADGEAGGHDQQQDGEGSEAHGVSRPPLGADKSVGQAATLGTADTRGAADGVRRGLLSDHRPFESLQSCLKLDNSMTRFENPIVSNVSI
jgi:hypothetical protein